MREREEEWGGDEEREKLGAERGRAEICYFMSISLSAHKDKY